MKILVLVESYVSSKGRDLAYVHTRNIEYMNQGIQVDVLNFSTDEDYDFDGITVLREKTARENLFEGKYGVICSHAPNLKNHFRFIFLNFVNIPSIIFFFHGHEVLRTKKYYPLPYPRLRTLGQKIGLKNLLVDLFDLLKLKILGESFIRIAKKRSIRFIFVSDWMKREFEANIPLRLDFLEEISTIIPNSIGNDFLKKSFRPSENKKLGNFVTIRPFDNPKYAIDVVVNLAKMNPDLTFHIYGWGEYFKHYPSSRNIKIFTGKFNHQELVELLSFYDCALLPTRLDSQGVLACELASYGMPLITSDIPICREIFSDFTNVYLISNESPIDLTNVLFSLQASEKKNDKFNIENTTQKELKIIQEMHKK